MFQPSKELEQKVVIIGAGCFGASTAYHLLLRGYTDVTVVDQSPTLPAKDAASNDLNRVVRSSYSDKFYTQLAREAISSWKDKEKWGDAYHESGVLVLGSSTTLGDKSPSYADAAYQNDVDLGAIVEPLHDKDAIRSMFPEGVRTGPFEQSVGYLNRDGGWANAGLGLQKLINHVRQLSGKFILGDRVNSIVRNDDRRAIAVKTERGDVIPGDTIIIATGSWTPSAFVDLDLDRICLATGQCMAMIQLSDEEADRYRMCPVVLDFQAGFYVFPPNEDNVIKFAIHTAGYTHLVQGSTGKGVSTPRTITSDAETGLHIPKAALQDLRSRLGDVYPDLAKKSFTGTRICWYCDTPDEDWIIGKYRNEENLMIATGGSGHAYKFLPVIGRLVADLVEGKLLPELVIKFMVDRANGAPLHSRRAGQPLALNAEDLASGDDWLFKEC